MVIEIKSSSERDTENVGHQLGKLLKPGDILALFGDLGAGKTALVRGLAKAMNYKGRVTSPTYSIVNEYPSTPPLFHFDMYRLSSSEDLYDIGWEDYLDRTGIYAIEWSERITDILPQTAYKVTITVINLTNRIIRIEGGPIEDSCN